MVGDKLRKAACTAEASLERYFGEADAIKGFDHRLACDAILVWFAQAEEVGPRRAYKCRLLQAEVAAQLRAR